MFIGYLNFVVFKKKKLVIFVDVTRMVFVFEKEWSLIALLMHHGSLLQFFPNVKL